MSLKNLCAVIGSRSAKLSLAVAAAMMLAQGAASAAATTPELAKLVAEAKAEGTINLAWAETVLGGSGGIGQIADHFNKAYGTAIAFKFTPMAGMSRQSGRLAVEYSAHQTAFIDLFLASAADLPALLQRDMIMPVAWSDLAPDRFIPGVVDQDGRLVKLGTGFTGADYNTQLAPSVPKAFTDFLEPEWKGLVATTDYAAGFEALGSTGVWGPERTIDYMKKLMPNLGGLITCGDEERLAVGEFAALVTNCTGDIALQWQAKGAPVDRMIPADAPVRRYYYLSVPKNSGHPAVAKLLVTYLLSAAGQQDCWDIEHMDLHLLPGSHSKALVDGFEAQGHKFTDFTIDYYLAHPEGRETQEKIVEMLRQKAH